MGIAGIASVVGIILMIIACIGVYGKDRWSGVTDPAYIPHVHWTYEPDREANKMESDHEESTPEEEPENDPDARVTADDKPDQAEADMKEKTKVNVDAECVRTHISSNLSK